MDWGLIGLWVDFLGALLLATDLLFPERQRLAAPTDPADALLQTVEALLLTDPTQREAALRRTHAACSQLGMHGIAEGAQQHLIERRLRRRGQLGVVFLVLGFFGQLVGAHTPTP
jgi:hypothetical protein